MIETVKISGLELVVMSKAEFEERLEDAADLAAVADVDRAGPAMPSEIAERLLAGEIGSVKAWRETVKLSQAELAEKAGVRVATVSDIENGSDPRLSTLRKLAEAMGVDVEDLV